MILNLNISWPLSNMSNKQVGPRPHGLRPFYPDAKPVPFDIKSSEIEQLSKEIRDARGEDLDEARHKLLWKLMDNYIPAEKNSVQISFVNHIEYTIARSRFSFDCFSAYLAASYSVRDRLIELFNDTQEYFISTKAKQVYYVSVEFLLGRFLRNALLNLELEDLYRESLRELGVSLDTIYQEEYDPGLGNGGLGRLAACFVDSMATLNLPGWGYGLMYSFGMFKQMIGADGAQLEIPDYWLNFGAPWRVEKPTVTHTVHFYGHVEHGVWKPSLSIIAVANDFLIPGFGTDNTLALRLWSSKPTSELDEAKFRGGDYYDAITQKQRTESLTSVLYPNDNTPEGKEMRLMQEFFMSSATLQDIIRRLKNHQKANIRELPRYAAIQLNDTHPAIMVAELLRLLIDEEDLSFLEAYDICIQVFSYTCHTLMPEALEKWDLPLFENLLPRHVQIIYQLNQFFIDTIIENYDDSIKNLIPELSIIEESFPKRIRMANLAVIGSHHVNGVAKIHSDLMKKNVFNAFYQIWPEKFINKTNGVTVRRWLHHCNPQLSQIITREVGDETWALNTDKLKLLVSKINDPMFRSEWATVKLANKERLAALIQKQTGITLQPSIQIFDVHVKRIHEYKRQQLNIFAVIYRYLQIIQLSSEQRKNIVPRVMIYAGKAAPGYYNAKKIIKLINNVAKLINNDSRIGDLLKVVYLPNYNVSLAEVIIPATDVSEQISTAGTEASGTSNMKFAFNGGLIIGTYDGATIEIADSIGEENVFLFGAKADEVEEYHKSEKIIPIELQEVFNSIRSGMFGEPSQYECLIYPIENGDNYLVAKDFIPYLEIQRDMEHAYLDQDNWTKMCIISTANMGNFSSDRTILEYANEVWNIQSCKLPPTSSIELTTQIPQLGVGSVGGSLRRHHTIAMKPGEVRVSGNNKLPPSIKTNKPENFEDSDSEGIPIEDNH